MFKKIIVICLIFCILMINNTFVFADDIIEKFDIKEIEDVLEISSETLEFPKINSKYGIVVDRNNKTILFGKNEYTKTKMASTTKIMTSLVVIENSSLDDVVEVSNKAAATGGSRLKIKKGDKITVRDLLYGLMLRSGNDAAVALAEFVDGSLEGFVELMNKKALELDLKNTHFVTPHGLDSEEHYTTPYELAILTDYALKNKVFAEIVNTKMYSININGYLRTITNTNELLGNLDGVYGVKTGFTNGAGRCLVTAVKRGDLDIICVVLGADTKNIRTKDSISLIEYSFANFKKVDIKSKIEEEFNNWKNINLGRININKGIKNVVDLRLEKYTLDSYTIKNNTENKFRIEINANLNLDAPVLKNTEVGEVIILYDNINILRVSILTEEKVAKKEMLDYIIQIIKDFNCYLEKVI